jgi:hypothetical protein
MIVFILYGCKTWHLALNDKELKLFRQQACLLPACSIMPEPNTLPRAPFTVVHWVISQKTEPWKATNSIMNLLLILLFFFLRVSFHCWKSLTNVLSSDLYRIGLVYRRPQWSRRLKHEPSSPSRKLGSWVRIPLEAWMSVCDLFCVCVVLPVGIGLATDWSPSKESYRLCVRLRN